MAIYKSGMASLGSPCYCFCILGNIVKDRHGRCPRHQDFRTSNIRDSTITSVGLDILPPSNEEPCTRLILRNDSMEDLSSGLIVQHRSACLCPWVHWSGFARYGTHVTYIFYNTATPLDEVASYQDVSYSPYSSRKRFSFFTYSFLAWPSNAPRFYTLFSTCGCCRSAHDR